MRNSLFMKMNRSERFPITVGLVAPRNASHGELLVAALLACLTAAPATADHHRSSAQRAAFVRANPCPLTGKPGPCPGMVVDHVIPLCAGGDDHPSNMQWLTLEAAREKDRPWVRYCAEERRAAEKARQK